MTPEHQRLNDTHTSGVPWKMWGPYLSDRQWGTVREDYSADGQSWSDFSHQQSHARAYRWGEDGLLGISDEKQRLCFALALWNGKDPVLKERFFGVTGPQGNHGEDVKEYYFYLDSTPTHSYLKALYKYPQAEYPYQRLVEESQQRDRDVSEFELIDTGIFNDDRYFDVEVEYAKASPEDILIQISVANRGSESATIHVLPTLWFRNTWSWGDPVKRPFLEHVAADTSDDSAKIQAFHPDFGERWLYFQDTDALNPSIYFTENDTNYERLYGGENVTPYVKDAFHRYVIHGETTAVNPELCGTKAAVHYMLEIPAGETRSIQMRLSDRSHLSHPFGREFADIIATRIQEANDFYYDITSCSISEDRRNVQRQAFAGLLWCKQYYRYEVSRWLQGDPNSPPPPEGHRKSRNYQWTHFDSDDIFSMPDTWEYPWFAAWDLAFHCIPIAMIDPELAKHQLDVMTREWYMHPSGQIPSYEWEFGDVNPPVHAWAMWRVYKIEQKHWGRTDRQFLERVFQKLLLNFTWWVNRKDAQGSNIFEGGFLGLDNIGVFDRSAPLPEGGHIEQSDGTSWMAMYCLNMLAISLELAKDNPVYEDMATKFFEHFIYIADAMNHIGETKLWNEEDGFFYDALHLNDGERLQLKVRSMVGLIPLFAVETLEPELLEKLPGFKERLEWFEKHRPRLSNNVASFSDEGIGKRRLLAVVKPDKLRRILAKMLNEEEFLSDYGIRSLSRCHLKHPYRFNALGQERCVSYEPAESRTAMFGGNSNWRGPVWFPVNYLLIESLQKFHHYLGDDFRVEHPTGSGQMRTLWEIAMDLEDRLICTFLQDEAGCRPVHGNAAVFQHDPHWRNYLLFYEYFHGDNGAGLGASHQTGWTGLVAKIIQQNGKYA